MVEQREPDKDKFIALKIEKAYKLAQSDKPPGEDDFTITLITRAFKVVVLKEKNNKGNSSIGSCFRCGKKGHIVKECRV